MLFFPKHIDAPIPHGRVEISPRAVNFPARLLLHPICRESLLHQILDQILILEIVQRIDTQRPVVKPEQRIYACCPHHNVTKLTNARHIVKFFFTDQAQASPTSPRRSSYYGATRTLLLPGFQASAASQQRTSFTVIFKVHFSKIIMPVIITIVIIFSGMYKNSRYSRI